MRNCHKSLSVESFPSYNFSAEKSLLEYFVLFSTNWDNIRHVSDNFCHFQTYFQPLDYISDVRNVGVESKETSYGGSDFLKILKKGDRKFAARKGGCQKGGD